MHARCAVARAAARRLAKERSAWHGAQVEHVHVPGAAGRSTSQRRFSCPQPSPAPPQLTHSPGHVPDARRDSRGMNLTGSAVRRLRGRPGTQAAGDVAALMRLGRRSGCSLLPATGAGTDWRQTARVRVSLVAAGRCAERAPRGLPRRVHAHGWPARAGALSEQARARLVRHRQESVVVVLIIVISRRSADSEPAGPHAATAQRYDAVTVAERGKGCG